MTLEREDIGADIGRILLLNLEEREITFLPFFKYNPLLMNRLFAILQREVELPREYIFKRG